MSLLLYVRCDGDLAINEHSNIDFLRYKRLTIMSEEQYNELQNAYTKETFANMIMADICNKFSEPYASMYCKQYGNFKKCRFL